MYPCILFALRRESAPFLRRFPSRRLVQGAPCPAWLCGESPSRVLVLETGVGASACLEAVHWLTETHLPEQELLQPDCVLCAGFAGALLEGWHVGDVLFAEEVTDPQGWSRRCDSLIEEMEFLGKGRLLTTPLLVGDPLEKAALGCRHGAVAVDMESAAVARFCAAHAIPFGSIRAISDDVSSSLSPEFIEILSGGGVSILRLCRSLLRSPGLVIELWRLARDTRRASLALAEALWTSLRLSETRATRQRDSSGLPV
jgi:adenosylhomocysteine nucleosidase